MSVVAIPAFNAERTIGETLASVQQQTHRDLEIFVIDDGSTRRKYHELKIGFQE